MKKIFLCLAVMFSAVFVAAEDMKFVTLLSQPVGSFSRVELLDQATPAEIFHLNFCNTDASGGNITVSSSLATPVDVEKLVVDSSATLGGNLRFVLADKITVYDNSGFEGGSLSAKLSNPAKILVDDEGREEAEFIHGNTVLIKTADFNTLNIYDKAVLDTPASGSTRGTAFTWQKVSSSHSADKATQDAYILRSLNNCEEQSCSNRMVWNPATCKCEFRKIDIGGSGEIGTVVNKGTYSCSGSCSTVNEDGTLSIRCDAINGQSCTTSSSSLRCCNGSQWCSCRTQIGI